MDRPNHRPEPPATSAGEHVSQPVVASAAPGTSTLAYQPPEGGLTLRGEWGTLAFGQTRVPARTAVFVAGIALWLGTLLIRTGAGGIGQIWASLLLLVPLVAVGSLTRTLSLRWLALMVLAGGALMGVMYLLAVIVITPLLDEISRPRDFVVPALEQLLVMLPLVVLVWRWRDGRAWSLGATDLLLAGVAVGIGFGLLEHAYLRAAGSERLEWFPLVGYHPLRLTPGHAVWAGAGGATLGLGLLLRSRGPMWLAVAASGSLLGFLDHAANNNTNWGDGLSGLLNAITLNGWLAVLAFFALAAACIGADLYILRKLEPAPHRTTPPRVTGLAGLRAGWDFAVDRRALAFARHQWWQAATGFAREQCAQTAAALEASLVVRQPESVRRSTEVGLEDDGFGVLFPSLEAAMSGSRSSPSGFGSSSEAHGS